MTQSWYEGPHARAGKYSRPRVGPRARKRRLRRPIRESPRDNGDDSSSSSVRDRYGLVEGRRFIVDADGYRSTRRSELQAMARFAAEQVRKSGRAFTFGVLNSTERRIIHMTLQLEEDLATESVGAGRDRRLQVSLK